MYRNVNIKLTNYRRNARYHEWEEDSDGEQWFYARDHYYLDDLNDKQSLKSVSSSESLMESMYENWYDPDQDDCSKIYCASEDLPVDLLINTSEFDEDDELTIVDVSLTELDLLEKEQKKTWILVEIIKKSWAWRKFKDVCSAVLTIIAFLLSKLVLGFCQLIIIIFYTPYVFYLYMRQEFVYTFCFTYWWICYQIVYFGYDFYLIASNMLLSIYPIARVLRFIGKCYKNTVQFLKWAYVHFYNFVHIDGQQVLVLSKFYYCC